MPIILIDTEQMFVLQRDAWYNINVNIVYYLRKKNYFRRKKKCVFFTVSFCTVCEISKTESRDLYADCIPVSYTHLDVYKRQACNSVDDGAQAGSG